MLYKMWQPRRLCLDLMAAGGVTPHIVSNPQPLHRHGIYDPFICCLKALSVKDQGVGLPSTVRSSLENLLLCINQSNHQRSHPKGLPQHEDFTAPLTPPHHPPPLSPPHPKTPPPTRRPLHHPLLNNKHHLRPHPNPHRRRNLHPAQPPLRPLHATSRHPRRRLRLQHLPHQPHTPARGRRLQTQRSYERGESDELSAAEGQGVESVQGGVWSECEGETVCLYAGVAGCDGLAEADGDGGGEGEGGGVWGVGWGWVGAWGLVFMRGG